MGRRDRSISPTRTTAMRRISAAASNCCGPVSAVRRRIFLHGRRRPRRWKPAMRLSVFGMGYVGCVTAACLARAGHEVIGVDVSETKVTRINRAMSPLVEPGLDDLIAAVVRAGRLRATAEALEGIERSDLAMICVG